MNSKYFKSIVIISTIFSMVNCAKDSSPGAGATDTNKKTISINGKSPQEYYSQFIYKITGECQQGNSNEYFVTSGDIKIGKQNNSMPIYAELEIRMFADYTYKAKYIEKRVDKFIDNGYSYDITGVKDFQSKWSINNDGLLILEDIGVATALEYNGSPSFNLVFNKNQLSEGLNENSSMVRKISRYNDCH